MRALVHALENPPEPPRVALLDQAQLLGAEGRGHQVGRALWSATFLVTSGRRIVDLVLCAVGGWLLDNVDSQPVDPELGRLKVVTLDRGASCRRRFGPKA